MESGNIDPLKELKTKQEKKKKQQEIGEAITESLLYMLRLWGICVLRC